MAAEYKIDSSQLNDIWRFEEDRLPKKYRDSLNDTDLINALCSRIVSFNRAIYVQYHWKEYGFTGNHAPWWTYQVEAYYKQSKKYSVLVEYYKSFISIDEDNNRKYGNYKFYAACSINCDLEYLLKKNNLYYEIIDSPCDKSKHIIRLYNKDDYKTITLAKYNNDVEIDDLVKGMVNLYNWLLDYDKDKHK